MRVWRRCKSLPDDYFIWITGEGKVVKNLSRRFEAEQYDPQRVRAAAYWHAK
ncbi:siderophore-interacting family protein [Shigella flexneri K-1770]|uniref:Siderophore-interacting protein n=1 Tax=Shigella flexneri TaxID=623 RepID=A0A658YU62_SHIFL|nr:siderophore-interacting domain protein [Shigella flexneri VA-6]EIQ07099.1 siderophore-interacting family protein [Shigella flexneri K-1770]SVH84714.1 siderophore-interacting protein [Shigella flexneri]